MNRKRESVFVNSMRMDELRDWWADYFDAAVIRAMFRGVTPRCYKYHWKVTDDE